MRRQQGGLPAIDGEVEPRLVPAYELGIDAREQAAIEQGAMLLALRQIDAVALAERIQAAGRAGVAATRERQRIDHAVPAERRSRHAVELGVEKAEIEGGVMHNQHGAFDEGEHVVGKLGEARLVAQELGDSPCTSNAA